MSTNHFEGWKTFGANSGESFISTPKTALKANVMNRTVEEFDVKLFLREDIYDWVHDTESSRFIASNNFDFKCLLTCDPEYDKYDGTIWLDRSCKGKQVDLKEYLNRSEFKALVNDLEKFQVALKELKEAFLKDGHSEKDNKTMNFSDWAIL